MMLLQCLRVSPEQSLSLGGEPRRDVYWKWKPFKWKWIFHVKPFSQLSFCVKLKKKKISNTILCIFFLIIPTMQLKEIICKNLNTAGLPFYGLFWMQRLRPQCSACMRAEEEGGRRRVHGLCHPPVCQNCSEKGGCVCRKAVSSWLGVFGQEKSSRLLSRSKQLPGQLGEHHQEVLLSPGP